MTKKADADFTAQPALLAFSAGVAVAVTVIAFAAQWSPAISHPAAPASVAEPHANRTEPAAECVFVNGVRRGPGHPYRQERDEKCRYEYDAGAPDEGGPDRLNSKGDEDEATLRAQLEAHRAQQLRRREADVSMTSSDQYARLRAMPDEPVRTNR